ncbi:MAG: hypothetical protein FH749_02465 [Firmicutes bacterium]|nr:hypothetical protein [Bacillota bacterium]
MVKDGPFDLEVGNNAHYTLQEAIDTVAPGGMVNVLPGDYELMGANPAVTIDKPLTLQGVDAAGNLIENKADVKAIINGKEQTAECLVKVEADDVTITGLELRPMYREKKDFDGEDYNVSDYAMLVTGNNFTLRHSRIVPSDPPVGDGDGSVILLSIRFMDDAKQASVRDNTLNGSLWVTDGAGQDGIEIIKNEVRYASNAELPGLAIDAYLPEVRGNTFTQEIGLEKPYTVLAFPESGDVDAGDWLLNVMSQNSFTSACVIVDSLTLQVKEVGEQGVYAAFAEFGDAAALAEAGDLIIPFHPEAHLGATFDSTSMPDGTSVAFPTEGPVAIVPKASLPGDGEYTVTITLDAPPADLPAGWEFIGGGYFTLEAANGNVDEFVEGEPAYIWVFDYPTNVDLDELAFFRYDTETEQWVEQAMELDAENNRLVVTTPRWSYFAMMQEGESLPPAEPGTPEPTTPKTGAGIMWLMNLGLVMLLVGLLLLRRRAVE